MLTPYDPITVIVDVQGSHRPQMLLLRDPRRSNILVRSGRSTADPFANTARVYALHNFAVPEIESFMIESFIM